MKLSEKQQIFARNVGSLLLWTSYWPGYSVTLGEAYRTKEQAELYAKRGIGIKNSPHRRRLAIDLNLFIDGKYQTKTSAYERLGLFWESLHPDNVWGGRFRDGNHFQMKP